MEDLQGKRKRGRPYGSKSINKSKKELRSKFLLAQNNACALCECMINIDNSDLDHSHFTGKCRGALCRRCNLKLAQVDKETKWYSKAVKYVELNEIRPLTEPYQI